MAGWRARLSLVVPLARRGTRVEQLPGGSAGRLRTPPGPNESRRGGGETRPQGDPAVGGRVLPCGGGTLVGSVQVTVPAAPHPRPRGREVGVRGCPLRLGATPTNPLTPGPSPPKRGRGGSRTVSARE